MNFIKRAFLSTKVKKGRTILLTLVFSTILIFILAGLTIQNASLQAIDRATKSTGATATLTTNMRNALEKSYNTESDGERPEPGSFKMTPIELDMAEKLANLDNVASYNYISTTSANADSFEPITSSSDTSDESFNTNAPMGGKMAAMSQGDVSISGTSSTKTLTAFSDGTNQIVDGVGITEDEIGTNHAIIESNLAEANDLAVGDTITVTSADDDSTSIELTIVGIYETTAQVDSRMMQFSAMNPSNTIYTSYTVANTLKGSDYENTVDSAVYTLSDPSKMDQFVEDAEKAGLDTDTYTLQTNDQVYQQMLQPIQNVADFAKNIVVLVTVAGVVILSLIIILMVRERKHEIGVLLSLGEKRKKVISQFFIEMLIVMIISLGIAGVSGKYVGNLVGEQLLAQENSTTTTEMAQAQDQGGRPGGFGRGGFSNFGASSAANAEKIEDLNITLSIKELMELGGIGLGITFVSIVAATVGIVRMQPKKILIS